MDFDKKHYDTEGPLGIPMRDAQAQMLDGLLKSLPSEDRQLVRRVKAMPPTQVQDGERADVSWISTEAIDTYGEIVVARGMNDAAFRLNPIVTNNHAYYQPPIGRSLWRKRAKDGPLTGILAKTQYPARPDSWPGDDWMPDTVLALIQTGMMQGKSIGFLRLKSHHPSSHEIAATPELANVTRIIDEWLLVEYAVTWMPANMQSLVQAVSKSQIKPSALKALGLEVPNPAPLPQESGTLLSIAHTSLGEIEKSIERQLASYDFAGLAERAVTDAINRARGRV